MTLTITSADRRLRAQFAPELGMLCAAVTLDGRERVDERRGVEAYRERGKTMGIPLLYPWANRLARREFELAGRAVELPKPGTTIGVDEHGLPIHGAMPRLMRWEAVGDGSSLDARLQWRSPELLALFPFAHSAKYAARAGPESELRITITVCADHGDPVPVAFGLHPYLRLPAPREAITLALPACERLTVDDQSIPTGMREPLGPGAASLGRAWDDGLVLAGELPAAFAAEGDGSSATVELLEGFTCGQVFSPEDAEFVCFEPMTAPANALISGDGLRVLEPGESLRTEFRILWSG